MVFIILHLHALITLTASPEFHASTPSLPNSRADNTAAAFSDDSCLPCKFQVRVVPPLLLAWACRLKVNFAVYSLCATRVLMPRASQASPASVLSNSSVSTTTTTVLGGLQIRGPHVMPGCALFVGVGYLKDCFIPAGATSYLQADGQALGAEAARH